MLVLFVITIGLLAFWIIVQNNKNRQLNAKLKNVPGTNSTYPILGDIDVVWSFSKWSSIDEKMKHFIEMFRDYPTTLKIWLGLKLIILINNPEDINTILTSPHCTDKSSAYHLAIGGDGLFIANGNKWKNQRRHLNTTFSPRVLNSFTNELNQFGRNIVAAFKEHVNSGNQFDLTPTLGIHLIDLISRTVYGSSQHKLELSKHCFELIERLMGIWGERMLQIYYHLLLGAYRKMFGILSEDKKLNKELRGVLQPIFDQKVDEYQNNIRFNENEGNNKMVVKDENFLEKLTRLRFEGTIGLSEYRHTSMTMFMAGTETSSRSISIILLLLAIHEDYQQKIYEEICNFFNTHGYDDIDLCNLGELNILDRFIKETFRLFPIVPLLGRTSSIDIPIKEGIIPAGTDIMISVVNLHQHPHIWGGDDAKKFNPDNFLPEAIAKRAKCSYIPFSYGPRNCIGYKFAQSSISIALVYLLKNYQFKTKLKIEDIKLGYGLTTYLVNENLVSIHSRNFNQN